MSSASGTSHYSPGRARGHGQAAGISAARETRDKKVKTGEGPAVSLLHRSYQAESSRIHMSPGEKCRRLIKHMKCAGYLTAEREETTFTVALNCRRRGNCLIFSCEGILRILKCCRAKVALQNVTVSELQRTAHSVQKNTHERRFYRQINK